jgi:transcriptional regulator with GAF, ATPase, and Fis domain
VVSAPDLPWVVDDENGAQDAPWRVARVARFSQVPGGEPEMAAETKGSANVVVSDATRAATAPLTALERITLQMTAKLHLDDVLAAVTQGLVEEFHAAFARIWLLGPGDLCAACYQAASCANRVRCLHLKASAGLYTNLNGEYRRVPLGAAKVGCLAVGGGPTYTDDALADDRLPNKPWLRDHGLVSFAGYPLLFQGERLGVLALFSRRVLREEEFDRLAVFAHQAAIAIKNAHLFAEVEALKNRLLAENQYLQEEIKLDHNFEDIIGRSAALTRVLRLVEQVAATEATVLILGETGTGKELVARAVHHLSGRRQRPLVKVNCAVLPAPLLESELFGHERGAFTGATAQKIGRFELAHGGTIFLDEVGELPLEAQVKLLRVLQEGEFERVGGTRTLHVDVRVIAATNRNLEQAIDAGTFREDLYYRLHVFPLTLPPLRERLEDLPWLVNHFVHKYAVKLGKRIETIPQAVMDAWHAHPWPGNVRELEHVIERAVILAHGTALPREDVLPTRRPAETLAGTPLTLAAVERQHIVRVLQAAHWTIEGPGGAARLLGLHPSTLRSRMRQLGITRPPSRG